jgi:glycopeptide antibiotics resistance protein
VRWQWWLTALYAAFVIVGSLVPFDFRPTPPPLAVAIPLHFQFTPIDIGERADAVSNLALFAPLGFLLASLAGRRCGVRRVVLVVLGCTTFSASIEVTQIFLASRTPALNDVLFNTVGASLGTALWCVLGGEVMLADRWRRARMGARPWFEHLLVGYSVALTAFLLLPLDLTVSLPELAEKYAYGGIRLRPFSEVSAVTRELLLQIAFVAALGVPLGVQAALCWTPHGTRRPSVRAVMLAACGIATVFVAQITVESRLTDVTTFLLLLAGACLGVAVARTSSRPISHDRLAFRLCPPRTRLVIATWALALVAWSWFPFNFTADRALVRTRMLETSAVPLRDFLDAPRAVTLVQWTGTFLIAGALPPALARARAHAARFPRMRRALLIAGVVGFACLLAIGRLLLPERPPDVTEIALAALAAAWSEWIVGRTALHGPELTNTARVEDHANC